MGLWELMCEDAEDEQLLECLNDQLYEVGKEFARTRSVVAFEPLLKRQGDYGFEKKLMLERQLSYQLEEGIVSCGFIRKLFDNCLAQRRWPPDWELVDLAEQNIMLIEDFLEKYAQTLELERRCRDALLK